MWGQGRTAVGVRASRIASSGSPATTGRRYGKYLSRENYIAQNCGGATRAWAKLVMDDHSLEHQAYSLGMTLDLTLLPHTQLCSSQTARCIAQPGGNRGWAWWRADRYTTSIAARGGRMPLDKTFSRGDTFSDRNNLPLSTRA
ncbi:hypothetical protein OPQ81_008774 [Rhizoctonia solani]|nr:hypothetical protein OPQ81_008774 [Rhizoctonia solani]